MSAIADVLWPGMKALESSSLLGGIYANKRGYHNKRENLPMPGYTTDYSIDQFSVDKLGPSDEAAAIDWTFPNAQRGDYSTISKYSKRLLAAGQRGRDADPRTVYMREFFGQIDSDTSVEGWDYAKNRAASSDSSHLWHIHISIHRKYVNDRKAMDAILSILKGESLQTWIDRWSRDVIIEHFIGDLPVLRSGDSDPVYGGDSTAQFVRRVQRQLKVTVDGDYGPDTAAAVNALGTASTGSTVDLAEYIKLYALWGATEIERKTTQGRTRSLVTVYFNGKLPVLKYGDSDDAGGVTGSGTNWVRRVQRALNVEDDGDYGPLTAAAVKALGINDGRKIDLPIYAVLYGLWGFEKTQDTVLTR